MAIVDWTKIGSSGGGFSNLRTKEEDEEEKKKRLAGIKSVGNIVDWSKVKSSGKTRNVYNFTPEQIRGGLEAEQARWEETRRQEESNKPKKNYRQQLWSNISQGFDELRKTDSPSFKIMAALAPTVYPGSKIAEYIQTPDKLKGDIKSLADIVRAFPRAYSSAGLTLAGQEEYQPEGKFEETLLGKEKIKDVWGRGQDALQFLGLNNKVSTKYALPVGLALTALDLAPVGGGGAKTKILKEFAAAKDVDAVWKTASKYGMNLNMTEINALMKAQSPREVGNIIGKTLETLKTPVAEGADASKAKLVAMGEKPGINVDRLNITDEAKQNIVNAYESIRPDIEKSFGRPLSNDEMVAMADKTQETAKRVIGREETKKWEAATFNLRRQLADQAEKGTLTQDFINNIKTLKSLSEDAGRKLQSFSKEAGPQDTNMHQVIKAILDKTGNTADDLLKEAQGVDFNDQKQAAEFYRKFVAPKTSEWVDLIRYNSMLTSPLTHIVNISSNLINTGIVAPFEKLARGGIDFLASNIKGRERQYFAGEGVAHLTNYLKGIPKAFDNFAGVMAGRRGYTNLDLRSMPVATKGAKGAVAGFLSYPLRLLEGMDQFFMALGESGELGSLAYREGKTGKPILGKELLAQRESMYRLFRQDIKSADQGHLLNAIDTVTQTLFQYRNHKNPLISNLAKFTVPFLKTPMNIFKQGVEYSPVGFGTLAGATNKTEQLSKAIIGSSVFGGAAMLWGSGRLTWEEPTGTNQQNEWRAKGKQPYSIKIGDTWVSYQKLPPPIAFPLAMVACLNDTYENGKIDDNYIDVVLKSVAKYGTFLSDQSYAKSIGDALTAVRGGESGIAKLISSYAQQMIPMRAGAGWLAKLTDNIQRKPEKDASIIDKQVQYLIAQVPGLSRYVPARTDVTGKPIENPHNIVNALSPFKISTEKTQTPEEFAADAKVQIRQLRASNNPNDKRKATELVGAIKEKKLGVTEKETKFKNLGVYDGSRAKAIFNYIKDLDREEFIKVMRRLRASGIMSDEVIKQVRILIRDNK